MGQMSLLGFAPRADHAAVTVFVSCLLILAVLPAGDALAEGELATATFSLEAGEVTVYLPADLRAGDRFTGRVEFRPVHEEREAELQSLHVSIDGVEDASFRGGRLTGRVVGDSGKLAVALKDHEGRVIDTTPLVAAESSRGGVRPESEPGAVFRLPRIAQSGRALRIEGPFDGIGANSRVEIRGERLPVVAESPRSTVVSAPLDPGPANVIVTEGGRTGQGEVRIVGVAMSVGTMRLAPGEITALELQVSGLDGIDHPLVVKLQNESPSIVALEGGDGQRLVIDPADADGGEAALRRTLTGRRAGSFTVDATLAADEEPVRHERLYLLSEGEERPPCRETGEGQPTGELTENEIAWLEWLAARLTPPVSLSRNEYCRMISRLMERILEIECRSEWVLAADLALGRHWNDSCREKAPHFGEGEAQTLELEDGDLLATDKSRLEVFSAADIRRLAEQTAAHGPIGRVEYVGHGCGCQGKMQCGDGILTLDELAAALEGLVKSGDCTIVLYSCEAGSDENLGELQSLADRTGCVVRAPKDKISPWTLGEFADWVEIDPTPDPTEHSAN